MQSFGAATQNLRSSGTGMNMIEINRGMWSTGKPVESYLYGAFFFFTTDAVTN